MIREYTIVEEALIALYLQTHEVTVIDSKELDDGQTICRIQT